MKGIVPWLVLSSFFFCWVFAADFRVTKEYEADLIRRVEELYTNRTPIYPLPKCGTPLMLELNSVSDELSPQASELLKDYLARPNLQKSYNSVGGHFKIHYDTSGSNAVYHPTEDSNPANGIPDYVDRCAEACDYSWLKEVDSMGYKQPPSDGSAGGDNKYDVYIVSLGWGFLGATSSESPTSPNWSYTSYIRVTNDFSVYGYPNQYDLMNVTIAHEFFHAVQFGYDLYEGYDSGWRPYWMEISSTWMEDQAFDDVNDYVGYLSYFYYYPWISLKAFSSSFPSPRAYHPYASCVFAIYLSEQFGVGVMKDIWEECGRIQYANTFAAIDTGLAAFGVDFDSAFKEFLVWNLFTKSRADAVNYYSEGSSFPEIKILDQQKHSVYPVNVPSIDSLPENLAANYVRFTPVVDSVGGLDMYFNGTDNAEWVVPVVGYRSWGGHLTGAFSLNAQAQGKFDFYNWTDYDHIYMIAAVTTRDSGLYNYGYADTFDIDLGAGQDELPSQMKYLLWQNFPNPFNSQTTIYYNLTRDGDISITIYNIVGQKVRALFYGYQKSGQRQITWNGRDDQERDLPSGIYFYRIETDGWSDTKRMVLLR